MGKDEGRVAEAGRGYVIESGVPIPPPSRSPGGKPKYPFAEMGIGDSFFVSSAREAFRVASAAQSAGRHRFTTRLCDQGLRVWRIG